MFSLTAGRANFYFAEFVEFGGCEDLFLRSRDEVAEGGSAVESVCESGGGAGSGGCCRCGRSF